MPFISKFKNTLEAAHRWASGALDWIVGLLSALRAIGFGAAMIVAVLSGAWLAVLPGSIIAHTYLPVRLLHLVTGFFITLGLMYEICRGIAKVLLQLSLRFKRRSEAPNATANVGGRTAVLSAQPRMLGAAYWILLGLVLISGFEVWIFQRYHYSLVPMVTPLRWRIVHMVATYYFGAVLLLVYTRHAVTFFIRLRAYLLSP